MQDLVPWMQADTIFFIVCYAFVSATMLVSNKWALTEFPYTQLVMLAQFLTSAVFVQILKILNFIGPTDETNQVTKEKIIKFLPIVAWFYGSVMTNLAAMLYLSVDLMILIRTCIPFLVAFGDYLFLGRSLPSPQSWFSLICLALVTAFVFVREPLASTSGLIWGLMYYVVLSGSMVFTKKFISDVKLTTHDRVLWNNALCVPPAIVLAFVLGDVTSVLERENVWTLPAFWAVLSSCVLGIAIAYAGWALRAKVSALTFTLIGVICKILSITINAMFLEHLSVRSMILIALGILASTFYEEPKARPGQVDVNGTEKKETKDIEKGEKTIPEMVPHHDEPLSPKKKIFAFIIFVAIVTVGFFWEWLAPLVTW